MSRNVKDSDDEMETKSAARKTRAALNAGAVDSPLRRSSRIKQTVQPEGSSPDSASDVSSVGPTRNTRRRTTTGDVGSAMEPVRTLRNRRNSAASDISELTETESLADGPSRRTTRRSIAGPPAPETPTKMNGRPRRTTRAGSESKSTPPVGRITRRTRATSLEPEGTEDEKVREVGTPIKGRRRASVLPSEPAVAEESEDLGRGGRHTVDKTVYEIDEDECVFVDSRSQNTSTSSRRKSSADADDSVEKMEIDESPVRGSEGYTIERSTREIIETDYSHVPKKLEESNEPSPQRLASASKGSAYTIENLLSTPAEKSPSNKENEVDDSVLILEKSARSSSIDVRLSSRKSMSSAIVKPQEKRHNISVDDSLLSNYCETPAKSLRVENSEIAKNAAEKLNRKERYSVDDCVVVIEPMEIDRVDKSITDKAPNSMETPEPRKTDQIVNLNKSVTKCEEIDGNTSLSNQVKINDNEIGKDIENELTYFKISNVVRAIADEKEGEKQVEQVVTDECESVVELKLQLDDPVPMNEEVTMTESSNNEKVSLESLSLPAEPRISLSLDESDKNDDTTASLISIRESQTLNDDKKAHGLNDETVLSGPSNSNLETIIPSFTINNEKTINNEIINENPINNEQSINNEKPINCDDIEENLIVAKDRKSSIVTESPTSGANGEEEASIEIEKKSRKSTSSGRSSNASELISTGDTIPEKSRKSTSSGRSSNASELTNTGDTVVEKSRKSSSSGRTSNASELKSTSDSIEEKSRKSTSSGRSSNASELKSMSDSIEEKTRKSISSGRSSNANELKNTSDSNEEKTRKSISSGRSSNANELKSMSDSNEEKTRKSISSGRSSNANELKSMSDSIEEKTRKSISSGRSSNANELKSMSDSIEEKTRKSISSGRSSNANELKNTSDPVEEKTRKSISSGRSSNANELKSTSDLVEEKTRKSISSGRSSNANELKSTSDSIEEPSPRKKIGNEGKAHDSDEESEYDGFPAFKDIPADEWTGVDTEASKRDADANSLHSVSTEHNDEECDVVFNTKEKPQLVEPEKEDQSRSEYDSDDTVKNAHVPRKSVGRVDREETVLTQVTRMDVSSDGNEENEIIINKEIVKRRSSLNNSRNIEETENTPLAEKNVSLTNEAKSSPIGLNSSKRNLLFNVDDDDNDNVSVKLNNSLSKPLKKRSLNISADTNGGSNEQGDQVRTPKIVNRMSLDGSGKKLKDRTLDTSQKIASAKSTPTQMEKKTNETSLLNWSLKKLHQNSDSDNSEAFEKSSASPALNKSAMLNKSAKLASAKKSKLNTSNSKDADASDSIIEVSAYQEYSSSPKVQLNKSAKSASAKKSKLNTSNVKAMEDLDSESDYSPDPREKLSASLSKHGSGKKLSKNNSTVSESPASPDGEDEIFETSSKPGSAKKTPKNKSLIVDVDSQKKRLSLSGKKLPVERNFSTMVQVNSDSELNEDVESDSSEEPDVSRKIPKFLFDHSSDDESSASIDSDVQRDMNLNGNSSLEYSDDDVPADDCMATESESEDDEDDGSDLVDFVVDDDSDEDEEDDSDIAIEELESDDDKNTRESPSSETKKPRKRIIPRAVTASDSSESEEEPMNVSSTLDKSKTTKTPIKAGELNKSKQIIEPRSDLNQSAKLLSAKKNKNIDVQSSTPKTLDRQSLLLEKTNSAKAATPLNKSLKANDSPKLEVSTKLSKSVCETIDTPTKLSSSFKTPKNRKSTLLAEETLQTSLPVNLSDSIGKTNLSKEKSTKVTMLNKSLVPPGSESPETRFLMKEKLNDTLPAMKLLRAKALRRSALENLREKVDAMDEQTEIAVDEETEADETEGTGKRASLSKEAANLPEVSSEKKKKKKKKKLDNSNASEHEEMGNSFIESNAELEESTSSKKSKKLKKKKAAEAVEETSVEEVPKKKKKKLEESVLIVESPDKEKKKKKKKKDRKSDESAEPEESTLKRKTRRNAEENVAASDSDDEPVAIDFAVARDAALNDLRKVTESIKAAQETKKKKHQELLLSSREERKSKVRAEGAGGVENVRRSIKRLPDDVLESLSDVPERPTKRRKLAKEEKKFVPSTSMFGPQNPQPANFSVDDGYIPLSSAGGTTQFTVVNLKKAVKHTKKAEAAVNFRERMLARNPRQPVSAYLMYQQKQKASGKGRPY